MVLENINTFVVVGSVIRLSISMYIHIDRVCECVCAFSIELTIHRCSKIEIPIDFLIFHEYSTAI